MITQTTLLGIKTLIFLGLYGNDKPTSQSKLASKLDASPSYLAKVANLLSKANLLRSRRGAQGGLSLIRRPSSISLLEIAEACQGKLLDDYCQETDNYALVCSFHAAMAEVHEALVRVMSHWKLSDLMLKPGPSKKLVGQVDCRIAGRSGWKPD